MLEDLRDNLVAGLGAVLLTKEKIEEVTGRLVEEARLSGRDARRLAEELLRAGSEQWASVESAVKASVKKSLSDMDIGSRREIEKLQEKVNRLQLRVDLLEDIIDGQETKR